MVTNYLPMTGLDFGPSNSDELNNLVKMETICLLLLLLLLLLVVDMFNCGEGIDVVLKFNLTQGDKADESNCEMLIQ
jgi:hypothetical protein